MVLYVSAASRFGCVAILDLYFSEYLLISSLTVGIPRSLRISSFLTYQRPFTIVLRILACITSILFIWLIAAVPHNGIPYALIGFMIVLYIFNLFSMLNLDFRLVSQCICLLNKQVLYTSALQRPGKRPFPFRIPNPCRYQFITMLLFLLVNCQFINLFQLATKIYSNDE